MVRRRSVALPYLSRNPDHVAETSRADHYLAPCGNRRIALLVPTSDDWDDRCTPLSYKKGNPSAVLPLTSLTCFRARCCRHSWFSLRLVFGQPATSPSPLLLHPLAKQVVSPSSSTTSIEARKKTERRTPSCIADQASVRGDVRVPPLDACSDVPLHRRWNLSSFSFPCTHPSPASS
jgi:hypothetical protein